MKLLFDQNLSHRLVGQLAAEFPGSAHVRDAGLSAASDPDVWAHSGIVEPVGGVVVIGPKKLSTIRKEIEQALAPTGADPIQRLERQIATAKRKGDRTEVMESLKRFLDPPRRNRRKRRVETKK